MDAVATDEHTALLDVVQSVEGRARALALAAAVRAYDALTDHN